MGCTSFDASYLARIQCGMVLLKRSSRLYMAISNSFGEDSAEMTEFLAATELIGVLVATFSDRSHIILNVAKWLSVIRKLVEEGKKGPLAFGVFTELIDAHIVLAEHVRRGRSQLVLDQIRPEAGLVEGLSCHEYAAVYLRIFTGLCLQNRDNGDTSDSESEFSSPFFPVRPAASASSAFAVSYNSDAYAPHLEVDEGEPMQVDSGYASSASSICGDHDYRGEIPRVEGLGSAFPGFDCQARLDGDEDYVMFDDFQC